MRALRYPTILVGLAFLALGFGFAFQLPVAASAWPWPDRPLSYLFIGSIFGAISAAALWIGWTGEFAALPAGALNVFVTSSLCSLYFAQLATREGRPGLWAFAAGALLAALASGAAFIWSRRLILNDARPMPSPVRASFWVFVVALILGGAALILRAPIFPWQLNPDSSVVFGAIFLGDAMYFLWGLFHPRWHNAAGQLLSFLAYDLFLIVPFLLLFRNVAPGHMLSLVLYVIVLTFSGALAVYYLILDPATRLGA